MQALPLETGCEHLRAYTLSAGKHRIGVLSLNNPAALNALSLPMVQALYRQLLSWRDEAQIACVLLQAEGEKAFCAGGDLQDLYRSMQTQAANHAATPDLSQTNATALQFFSEEYRLDLLIHRYTKPILCWGQGYVMGGGIGLMSGASHRVVSETSRLAMPEVSIGLFPDVGGSWLLSRMPHGAGIFLGLTGTQIQASDALYCGLADYAIKQANFCLCLATLQAQNWSDEAAENQQILHQVLRTLADRDAEAFATPGPLQQQQSWIARHCQGKSSAAVLQQLLQADPTDAWLQKALLTLRKGSLLSASLAWTLQNHSRHLSLAQVFSMELQIALHCCAYGEFQEGIRALLIDKDKQPRWRFAMTDFASEELAELLQSWLQQRWAGQIEFQLEN